MVFRNAGNPVLTTRSHNQKDPIIQFLQLQIFLSNYIFNKRFFLISLRTVRRRERSDAVNLPTSSKFLVFIRDYFKNTLKGEHKTGTEEYFHDKNNGGLPMSGCVSCTFAYFHLAAQRTIWSSCAIHCGL